MDTTLSIGYQAGDPDWDWFESNTPGGADGFLQITDLGASAPGDGREEIALGGKSALWVTEWDLDDVGRISGQSVPSDENLPSPDSPIDLDILDNTIPSPVAVAPEMGEALRAPGAPVSLPGAVKAPEFPHTVRTKAKTRRERLSRKRFSLAAVEVLEEWLENNAHDPYPTKAEKVTLAAKCGLMVKQVSTWLSNARSREKESDDIQAWLSSSSNASEADLGVPPVVSSAKPEMLSQPLWQRRHGLVDPPLLLDLDQSSMPSNTWEVSGELRAEHPPPADFSEQAFAKAADGRPPAEDALSYAFSRAGSRGGNRGGSRGGSRAGSRAGSAGSAGSARSVGSRASTASRRSTRRSGPPRKGKRLPPLPLPNPKAWTTTRRVKDHGLPRLANHIPCTFCHKEVSRNSWKRHEETMHQPLGRWVCMAGGFRFPSLLSRGLQSCAFCRAVNPGKSHPDECGHRIRECLDKPEEERTFWRKEHLVRHIRDTHMPVHDNASGLASSWYSGTPNLRLQWTCGFCGDTFLNWHTRATHLLAHFDSGKTLDSWDETVSPQGSLVTIPDVTYKAVSQSQTSDTVHTTSDANPAIFSTPRGEAEGAEATQRSQSVELCFYANVGKLMNAPVFDTGGKGREEETQDVIGLGL